MSLYIGNLSPRVGKDELEHTFGRFGRCHIRLKDGYGFAIYGIRAQAEVALRALRGRNICGLPISLSWSNKQPNGGSRPYETQPGRGFGRQDHHNNGPLRSNARPQYKFRQPDGDFERIKSDLPVENESADRVSEERKGDSKKEDEQVNVDHNMLDRYEPAFDRYEPDHDLSSGKEISEDKFDRNKMRDCTLQDSSRVRKLGHSDDRRGRVMISRRTERKDSVSGRVKRRRISPESSDRGKAHDRRKKSDDENENFRHRRHGKRAKRSFSSSASSSHSSSTSRSSVSTRLNTRLEKSKSKSPAFLLNKTDVNLNGFIDISTSLQTKPDVMLENQNLGVTSVQENQQLEVVANDEKEENLGVCADVEDDYKIDQSTTYTTRANDNTISLDELERVMKHYNMKQTEDNGGYLSIEDYFGGARFWPWEIIYYRRLKKGPISTENYATRIAQNKEFDITDKYVRSSSGWGEPIQEL